jgi:hypothetical protein
MKLWKIVLFAVAVLVTSCSIQPKPRLQITHVLAVTHEGDTLKLPIDVIRPVNYRIINYSSGYGYGWNNWYRPYYHNYIPSYGSSSSSSGRGSSNNSSSNSNSSKNNYGQSPNPKSVPLSKSENIKEPRK